LISKTTIIQNLLSGGFWFELKIDKNKGFAIL